MSVASTGSASATTPPTRSAQAGSSSQARIVSRISWSPAWMDRVVSAYTASRSPTTYANQVVGEPIGSVSRRVPPPAAGAWRSKAPVWTVTS